MPLRVSSDTPSSSNLEVPVITDIFSYASDKKGKVMNVISDSEWN